jgi:hypothetical protein
LTLVAVASFEVVTRTSSAPRRRRALALIGASAALVTVAAAGAIAYASRSAPTKRAAADASTAATLPPVTTFRLAGEEVPASGATSLPSTVSTGVLATLNRYLDSAVITPMRSGRAAGDLSTIFTASAAQRLSGADRATLVEDVEPGAGRNGRVDEASARLTGLLDSGGSILTVAAKVDVVLRTGPSGAETRVARSGELVLVPDGGAWRIDGYDLRVTREPVGEAAAASGARP